MTPSSLTWSYSGFRVDGTIPKLGGLYGPLSKGHLGVPVPSNLWNNCTWNGSWTDKVMIMSIPWIQRTVARARSCHRWKATLSLWGMASRRQNWVGMTLRSKAWLAKSFWPLDLSFCTLFHPLKAEVASFRSPQKSHIDHHKSIQAHFFSAVRSCTGFGQPTTSSALPKWWYAILWPLVL